MARQPFSEQASYRGGRVNPDDAVDDKPKRLRYPCFAEGCPMPGTIQPGVTKGDDKTGRSHEEPGTCAWHYGALPKDIPKVTQRLQDWRCVSNEIDAARRVLTGDMAADPKGQDDALAEGWRRLQPALAAGGWGDELQPQAYERLGDWARRLERFLAARVVEVLSTNQRRSA